VVQTFFQDSTVLGMAAARLACVPVRLVAFRDLGFWRNPRQEFLMRRAYPLATGFLANSQAVKDRVCTRDRLDPSRVRVIHNGIDSSRFRFVEHPEDEVAIGIVGNLNRRVKRADLFLRAAARVAARYPGVTWHLIGDGELRPQYEALAAELGIAGHTVFTGRLADVPTYLQRLAIGVICSDSEGFSNAILEYMLSGCAVVATAVGGNLEAVHDGKTGLLVPPGDEVALANALSHLVEERAVRLRIARNARAMVEREFGWARCLADHEEYYLSSLLAAGAA
jgi:glycosyltransferase involved in cell wall biosynthesis